MKREYKHRASGQQSVLQRMNEHQLQETMQMGHFGPAAYMQTTCTWQVQQVLAETLMAEMGRPVWWPSPMAKAL